MSSPEKPLALGELAGLLLREAVEADAAMQLHQAKLWREVAALHPLSGGVGEVPGESSAYAASLAGLMEGVDRQSNLTLGSLEVMARLEEVRPPLLVRLYRWVRSIPPPDPVFRFARGSGSGELNLKIGVIRKKSDGWETVVEPDGTTRIVEPPLSDRA